MGEIIYKELSYEVVGVLYEVFNELEYGYKEKFYENATAVALKEKGIKYIRQVPYKVLFHG